MQIVRTILWLVLLVALVILTVLNWETTLAMRIWPGLVWDTRLPAIVVVSFLIGLVPTWLVHRGTRWQLNRRIARLEMAARNSARPAEPVMEDTSPPPPSLLAGEPLP